MLGFGMHGVRFIRKLIARKIGPGHHAFLNNNRIALILSIIVVPDWKPGCCCYRRTCSKFPSDHAALVTEFTWAEPTPSQRLRLVSYNIKHGLGNDGRLDLERTAALLNNLHADFIGLQEVDNKVKRSGMVDQAQTLGKSLSMHSAFGSFMDYQGGKYGLGILSKHPILAANEIKLPTGNEPRVALACKIQLPDRREIMVVNLHFDWVKDDKFRFQQAKELAKYLGTLTLPYVLMGDFNDVAISYIGFAFQRCNGRC